MSEEISMLFGGEEPPYERIVDKKEFLEFLKSHKKDLQTIKKDIEEEIEKKKQKKVEKI